jgi:hypothetical protein
MKCPYWRNGCTFEGQMGEVDDHVDYMVKVGDDEHKTARKTSPTKPRRGGKIPVPRCPKQPKLQFDQIDEEFHLTCECGMDENLGQEPIVPDIVFVWQEHSKMKRREDDSGGPRGE